MNPAYHIIATRPYTYLNEIGQVIDGYQVFYEIPEFAETHHVNVPNLNPESVKQVIEKQVKARKDLSTI